VDTPDAPEVRAISALLSAARGTIVQLLLALYVVVYVRTPAVMTGGEVKHVPVRPLIGFRAASRDCAVICESAAPE
jgi:hypothetical protein